MKYLIIGAGGTGGAIGAYMAEAGKNVTFIARGAHLAAIKKDGLRMETGHKGNYAVKNIRAFTMEEYEALKEQPDVIFVCVKGYSIDDTIPFISRIAGPETTVIPVLNIYGTGGRMQKDLPDLLVTDGCIYVAAEIKEPGCILMKGEILRVVYGVRDPKEYRPVLAEIHKDLKESGIESVLSENIRKDAFKKFSYISPAAACGQYYDVSAGEMQKPGEIRDTFVALIREVIGLAEAMDIHFEEDMVEENLRILDGLAPVASTSMQRDIWQGKQSEVKGLVLDLPVLGREYGADLPMYEKVCKAIAEKLSIKE